MPENTEQKGDQIINDNLISAKNILSILLAAAATALCAIIDYVIKEGNNEHESSDK